jgi:Mrp family chromosome partitioning ATPase
LGALGIAFSAAVGLGLALGVAVFREANQRRVYTEDEVEAASGVINLTVIPRHQSDFKRRETRRNGGVKNNSAVRKLFFSLQLMDQKSVKLSAWLITSSRSEQEKAELGISLARLAAASGLKVVIIDCNLRRPELHKALGMENEKGLVDLLMARSDVQNVLQNDPVSDCRFIAAGLVDDSMVERCLRAERLKSAMRKLRLEFDIIILVAPSLGQSADPLMLMSVADGALFVVPSGEETLSGLRSNVQQLRRSSEAQIFTVLTNSPVND